MKYRILLIVLATALAAWGLALAEAPPANPPERDVQDLVFLAETRPVLVRLHIRLNGKALETAWDEFVDHLFDYLDTDGDGVLSQEEAQRAPLPQVLFNSNSFLAGAGTSLPRELNAGRDGKVSRADLARYYHSNGGGPVQMGDARRDSRAVRRAVLASSAGGVAAVPSSDSLNDALFNLLDANKDGKLSREELAAAPEVLGRLDVDDDEMVTSQELLGTPTSALIGQVAVRPPAAPMAAAPADSAIVPVTAGDRSQALALARQLQTRYGPRDTPASRRNLTRKDLGLDQAAFEALDADGNGELDSEELTHFAERPADLELTVRLGRKGRDEAVEIVRREDHPSPVADSVHKDRQGNLLLDLGNTRLTLKAADLGPAGPQAGRALRQQYLAQFKVADTDNNGYLDRDEAQRNPFFRGLFQVMDRDGDGKLFEKEVVAYLDAITDLTTRVQVSMASLSVVDQGKGLFDLLDTDHDGRLSVRELRNAARLVDQLDRDGDGCVDRNEVPRSYQVTVQQGPASSSFGSQRVVVANNGFVGGPSPVPTRTAGPLWFRKMDRNRDGDVSRREFLGTDEEFRQIDTDGDGLISAEEAERADEHLRKR